MFPIKLPIQAKPEQLAQLLVERLRPLIVPPSREDQLFVTQARLRGLYGPDSDA